MSNATWMADNTFLHTMKLRNICLPVTHDSGTCALTEQMTPDQNILERGIFDLLQWVTQQIASIPGVNEYIPNPAAWVYDSAYASARGLATATSRTIAQQLDDGIRGLDLRVFYDTDTKVFSTFHGFVGTPMTSVLADIQAFLKKTKGEILFVTCSHYQPTDDFPHSDFESLLLQYLKDALYAPVWKDGVITNDPFGLTYADIVGTGKSASSKIILVNPHSKQSSHFWPDAYCPPDEDRKHPAIAGAYSKTTDRGTALKQQASRLQSAVDSDLPFALYMTLTPGGLDYIGVIAANLSAQLAVLAAPIVLTPVGIALEVLAGALAIYKWTLKWETLLQLSQLMDLNLGSTVVKQVIKGNTPNPVSLLYLDWYETTNVVNLAIDLAAGRSYAWSGNEGVTFSGSPASKSADHSPALATLAGQLYMFYPYKSTLYQACATDARGTAWSGGTAITTASGPAKTSWNATAATWAGAIHLAWLDAADATTVRTASYDGTTWTGNAALVIGGATVQSKYTPALAVYADTLFLAYRGVGKDTNLYVATCDPLTRAWTTPTALAFGGSTPATSNNPTLAVYDGKLYLFYLGNKNDTNIYVSVFDGTSWSGNKSITTPQGTPLTNYGPSAIAFGGALWTIFKGQGSNTLRASWYNGVKWAGNQAIGDAGPISPESNYNPGLAVFEGALVMAYKGGSSNTIYTAVYGPE